jgi:hypothetical protein
VVEPKPILGLPSNPTPRLSNLPCAQPYGSTFHNAIGGLWGQSGSPPPCQIDTHLTYTASMVLTRSGDGSRTASCALLQKQYMFSDPPRTRTWNLRLRGPTPYPLGQRTCAKFFGQQLVRVSMLSAGVELQDGPRRTCISGITVRFRWPQGSP